MKKALLMLIIFLSIQASAAMVEKEVTINFQKFPELTLSPEFNFKTMANNGQTNCTTYKIIQSPITISFSTGKGTLGAAIYRIDDFYRLILRAFCDMIFEVSGGCQLTSIKFYNTNSISEYSVGRFDTNANQWLPDGATNVNSLTLSNGFSDSQISMVTIKYKTPATPLIFSSIPSEGDAPSSFSTMQLSFNTSVSKINDGAITLTGTTFTGTKKLSPSVSGRTGTLTLGETITDAGTYTVHIPAGVFETSEGVTNDAKEISFTIVPKRDIFNPDFEKIVPPAGTYGILPTSIRLTFDKYVKIGTGTVKFSRKEDNNAFSANVAVDENDPKSVLITHKYNEVKAGTWTLTVPEKLFHTDFPETDVDYIWNEALSLNYIVDGSQDGPQDTEIMKAAKELLKKTGVGYPKKENKTYKALNDLVNAEEVPSDEALTAAMNALYDDAEVLMPIVGNWYTISCKNAAGTELYLTFNEDKTRVLLGKDSNKAAVFKVKSDEGNKYVFQTKEGWFLHVPHTLPNYEGTSKKNLTTEESDINKLTLVKFASSSVAGVESKDLYGAFTIYGSVGSKKGLEYTAYATVNFDDLDFSTDPDSEFPMFSAKESSAFFMNDATEPLENVEYIHPYLTFIPSSKIEKPGDELYASITGPLATEIKDNKKIYFTKDGVKQTLSKAVLTLTDTSNKFSVYTEGLAAGESYVLVVEEGALKYTNPDGKFVIDEIPPVAITIGEEEVTPSTPEKADLKSSLSAYTLSKAGAELILSIDNVIEATLTGEKHPSFMYADGDKKGETVPYEGSILTPKTGTKTQFNVNTDKLEPGNYTLLLPAGTFKCLVESGKDVTDVDMTHGFTIEVPEDDFIYSYTNLAFVTTKDRNKKGIDVIQDVDLNDFVICVYDFWGYSALYGNPNGKVSVRSTFGGDVVSGHFEPYSTKELVKNYGDEYNGAWALKFKPDVPIKAGQLKNNPGMYAYYIYPGAIGDDNYRKYLKGDKGINMSDCIVNPGMAASKFYVNNKEATGIKNISVDDVTNPVIYDLQGRRVTNTSKKGVYIVNGRKVVVK